MKEIMKNKKVMYIFMALIILIGIICIFVFKLNYTLMYDEHTTLKVYLGKEYYLKDIEEITKEVFGNEKVSYQKIETFGDSIAINIKEVTDEQINELSTKLKDKYEIEESEEIVEKDNVAHLRGVDIIKPYIVPILISTLLIIVYVGIRYFKLGALKVGVIITLRLAISEILLLSIIAITRIPIGAWTMPFAIFLYMIVAIFTAMQFEKKLEKSLENSKKNS